MRAGQNIGFTSQFNLAPNTSVLITFSGKPKLKPYGFWSFTVYGPNQYLIPNSLNRFEIGDRTASLVYQGENELVYGDNVTATRDGPFQVLVQPVGLTPPADWTSNWLPSTQNFSAIGNFFWSFRERSVTDTDDTDISVLALVRWYTPQDAMTNGSYVYPKIEIVPSIV